MTARVPADAWPAETIDPDTGKARCTATAKSTGNRCTRTPVAGAAVCTVHGATKNVKAAGKERVNQALAVAAVGRLGLSIDIDPRDALLEAVGIAAYRVQQHSTALADRDVLTDDIALAHSQLLAEWHGRMIRAAAEAAKAGVEERRVQLAESQGRLVADLIRNTLGDPELGLTPEQITAGQRAAGRHLRVLQGGAAA